MTDAILATAVYKKSPFAYHADDFGQSRDSKQLPFVSGLLGSTLDLWKVALFAIYSWYFFKINKYGDFLVKLSMSQVTRLFGKEPPPNRCHLNISYIRSATTRGADIQTMRYFAKLPGKTVTISVVYQPAK